jgi:hypothetical protein
MAGFFVLTQNRIYPILSRMVNTLTAKWELVTTYRGVSIFRRVEGTGTVEGKWCSSAASGFSSMKKAKEYLDTLPIGYFCGRSEKITE